VKEEAKKSGIRRSLQKFDTLLLVMPQQSRVLQSAPEC
jgi:hypothetical protein